VILAIEGGLRLGVSLLHDRRKHPAADVGECRADSWRDLGFVGLVRRSGFDDRRDRLLGLGATPEREQAERAVLIDGPRVGRRAVYLESIQHGQRVLIRRRQVELAGTGQRVLGEDR
jgi:hypothetical protein